VLSEEQASVVADRLIAACLAAWLGLLGREAYLHALPLVVGTIPVGFMAMRLVARKLVAKFVRETVHRDT